jgi:3-hydroxyacyl-[acyl-carrier-protein] dehydratase
MAQPLIDYSQFDFEHPLYDEAAVREINPQRFEMAQLTAVVYVDTEKHLIVGYKDVTDQEFWVRGHMPEYPLMPGVMLCECAAQLAGFYARKFKILGGDFLGFGGMNEVRFRLPVYPNSRLILVAQLTKLRPNRLAEYQFQGFVDDKMVFSGGMLGVPIHRPTADGEPS